MQAGPVTAHLHPSSSVRADGGPPAVPPANNKREGRKKQKQFPDGTVLQTIDHPLLAREAFSFEVRESASWR